MATDSRNVIFAKVVHYLATRMAEDAEPYPDEDEFDEFPEGLETLPETLHEIADSFEREGGFRFEADEALALSHLFTVLEAAMRVLAAQADEAGQTVAAARIEWSADQAREMMGYLMEKHGSGDGGELVVLEED